VGARPGQADDDRRLDRATLLAAALAGLFATLWFVVPLLHRLRRERDR
jgi:hypothetical protein